MIEVVEAVTANRCDAVVSEKLKTLFSIADLGFKLILVDGKKPKHKEWQSKASGERFVIEQRHKLYPQSNWGIVTGEPSGVFVIDIDGPEGTESLKRLETDNGPLPATLRIRTGRGEHVYFRYPGHHIPNSVGKVAPHIDVRGDGAFAVCPPSIHESGKAYEFVDAAMPIAEAPHWLLEAITTEHLIPVPDGESIPEGSRNDTLFKSACALCQAQVSQAEVLNTILTMNKVRCNPPLDEAEVKILVSSASRYAAATGGKAKHSETLYWYPMNCYRFLTEPKIAYLRDYQVGWYSNLQAHAWLKAGVLPADKRKLAVLARASSKKKFLAEVEAVLFDYEPTTLNGEDVLINRKMSDDYGDTLAKWIKRQEAGRRQKNTDNGDGDSEGKAA